MSRQSNVEVYLHFVWATHGREHIIEGELKRPAYRCIASVARSIGCTLLALGGVADHVHLLVRVPSTIAICDIARRVKSNSSRLIRDNVSGHGGFAWQGGYGVFSLGREQVGAVKAYVNGQAKHHATGSVWPDWEETGREDEDADDG